MTERDWLDHWLQQAPPLSSEALDGIHDLLTAESEDAE